jgi:hypothetical protein
MHTLQCFNFTKLLHFGSRDSSVGTETRYGLDSPGIKSRWGQIFRTRPDRPWVHPASYTVGSGSSPGVKRPGRGFDHPPHLGPRLKKEYSYTSTPPGPSWPVLGWPLPLLLPSYCDPHWPIIIDCSCTKKSLGTVVRSSVYKGLTQKLPKLLKKNF